MLTEFQKVSKNMFYKILLKEKPYLSSEIQNLNFVPIRYLFWLKRQCVKVIPIGFNLQLDKIYKLMDFADGILFIGGNLDLIKID